MNQLLSGHKGSFAGGEFSPALYSRIDLAKYSIGARTLRNFIIHPTGGISNRPGLEYIATEKTSGKKIRLFPFEFSTTQTYVIELGDYYARFYADGVQIEDASTYDNYTKLMLHCNVAGMTDEIGKTITKEGEATLDESVKKFGAGSVELRSALELDYMEYANDAAAQAAYVSNDASNFQSYSESTIKQQGSYSLKVVAAQTDSLNDTLTKTF